MFVNPPEGARAGKPALTDSAPDPAAVANAVEASIRRIPPAWPLAATVAVNPFVGQAMETLAHAGARLGRISSAAVTMPRQWYRDQLAAGGHHGR